MDIAYAQVINSFVSTEGKNGIMTNYIYYSVLVVFKNGTRQIVEDRLQNLGFLLPYIRTPQDALTEIQETSRSLRELNDIVRELKSGLKALPDEMNRWMDQKIGHIVNSLFMIPDVLGMEETEAKKALEQSGFIWHPVIQYPEGTPENGIVRVCSRNGEYYKMADVTVFHPMPDVLGLPGEEALNILQNAGFTAEVRRKTVTDQEDDRVLECARADDYEMKVSIVVSAAVPETKGMPLEEAGRLLRQAGYIVQEEAVPGLSAAGNVASWQYLGQDTVILRYGIPEMPDVLGMEEAEARKALAQAGFIWHPMVQYPEGTPENGVVRACARNGEDYRTADVTVFHPVPDVLGLPGEEALKALKDAGFAAEVRKKTVTDQEDGRVLECMRPNDDEMKVALTVSAAVPEMKGMPLEEAGRLLREAGYSVQEEAVPGLSAAGKVVSWQYLGQNTVSLRYCIPETAVRGRAEIEWNPAQGSAGDQYAAKTVYYHRDQRMTVTVTGRTGSKVMYQILGVSVHAGPRYGKVTVGQVYETEQEFEFDVTMDHVRYEDLPDSLFLQMDAQYGLVKKMEYVSFRIRLLWPQPPKTAVRV